MGKFYANSKIFHFPDRLSQVENREISNPVHIRLKPTNKCNHRCSYCCYRNENLFLSQLMDEKDQIPEEKMSELIKDLGVMGIKAVTFSGGGEPLCYPSIYETVAGLVQHGIKVAMLSNGGLLKGNIAELLAREAVWLRISIDGPDRDSYARSRGVSKDEFDKVCDNIRNFAALPGRKCVLGLNLIVTTDNSEKVYDFLQLARDMGVDHVKVSGVVVSTEPSENSSYHVPIYQSVHDQLERAINELSTGKFSIIDMFHKPGDQTEIYEKEYHWCPMARFLTIVAADQNVYTCQDKAYTTSGLIGSIRDTSFKGLWQSEETSERLRNLDPSLECRHHCVANNKNMMLLDYFSADPDHIDFV